MKHAIFLVAAALLAGCATTENYQRRANSWIGATELSLVRAWGSPTNVYETGGRKFITYSQSRSMQIAGVQPTYSTTRIGNTYYTQASGGMPAQDIGLHCTITFEVLNDVVVTWNAQGNYCVSE